MQTISQSIRSIAECDVPVRGPPHLCLHKTGRMNHACIAQWSIRIRQLIVLTTLLCIASLAHAQIACPSNAPANSECTDPIFSPWQYELTAPPLIVFSSLEAAQAEGLARILTQNYCSAELNGNVTYACYGAGGGATCWAWNNEPTILTLNYEADAFGPAAGQNACMTPSSTGFGIRHRRTYSCPPTYRVLGSSVPVIGIGVDPPSFLTGSGACFRTLITQTQYPRANGCLTKGNPCDVVTGNKQQSETDYATFGPNALEFKRTYLSQGAHPAKTTMPLGAGWFGSYLQYISSPGILSSYAYAVRPDGAVIGFYQVSTGFAPEGELPERLEYDRITPGGSIIGWRYTTENDDIERYNLTGRLLSIQSRSGYIQTLGYSASGQVTSVTDSFGRQMTIQWSGSRIAGITDPAGHQVAFEYDANGNLVSATYPDGTQRHYLYELTGSGQANLLTGLEDESGNRYGTWTYGAGNVVTSSEHAGGVQRYVITYNTDGSRIVVDPIGTSHTYTTALVAGQRRYTGSDQPCEGCKEFAQIQYDTMGNFATTIDFKGTETHYTYDVNRSLELIRTEAFGTSAARTITTS